MEEAFPNDFLRQSDDGKHCFRIASITWGAEFPVRDIGDTQHAGGGSIVADGEVRILPCEGPPDASTGPFLGISELLRVYLETD
jgi:hypothetical protein